MLPTPDTSHVPYSQVYEPAEDSFLLLDTLSSASETAFLHHRFAAPHNPTPLVVEVGTGSGVVIGFVNAQAIPIFGSPILTAGVDVNRFACTATATTVKKAVAENPGTHGQFLGALTGDLLGPLGTGQVDVLIFNPPYVPTEELPPQDERLSGGDAGEGALGPSAKFERDSYLLSLSYAGGKDGMEITNRLIAELPEALSARGCAYILLCAGNKPEGVKARIKDFGPQWNVITVGESGKQAGWEKLQIIRIWKEEAGRSED
ncbi:S-adenosylmethionine-dependent methyltransferase [Gnomoniopsis sp. IMI 355080]|nr:S-adenosylmethionine-dependent methyltransferase [Gnomoniopsis sp. IMI 355080]